MPQNCVLTTSAVGAEDVVGEALAGVGTEDETGEPVVGALVVRRSRGAAHVIPV
jgi:hypothetical protein